MIMQMIETNEKTSLVVIEKRSRRAKRVRITIGRDGSVTLTRPFFISQKRARLFLESQAAWVQKKQAAFSKRKSSLFPEPKGTLAEYRALLPQAKELILERLTFFQNIYQVSWKKVSIRNQKTRWGSCSARGAISFNYRLFLLPEHLRDYIIVHELCHLIELNHSSRFWSLVEKTFPDYRDLRKKLHLI